MEAREILQDLIDQTIVKESHETESTANYSILLKDYFADENKTEEFGNNIKTALNRLKQYGREIESLNIEFKLKRPSI